MLAICIECSHQRGMGHLFRALNLIRFLKKKRTPYVLLSNADRAASEILREQGVTPVIVDLQDTASDWEGRLIVERGITVWLNDRLDTGAETAAHVKRTGILLFTVDDMGAGAELADGNFASLIFDPIQRVPGKAVYRGSNYLILNPEIAKYRRPRERLERILVTLGGSDTYGVTLRVIAFLKKWRRQETAASGGAANRSKVTILIGPGSAVRREAEAAVQGTDFTIATHVPSLMAFFAEFDFAITGGGVTALEAAASGLPCMVIANERHEIQIGEYLERTGCALFAGYYQEMVPEQMTGVTDGQIREMSRRGMEAVDLLGTERIYDVLTQALRNKREEE